MYQEYTTEELQHLIATKEDQLAYKELYNRFAPGMISFADQYLSNLQAAEEIVSDVFIRIWLRRSTLDQISNLKVYIYVSVRNFSNNYLKSLKTKPQIRPIEESEIQIPASQTYNPQQVVQANMLRQRILTALTLLPPRCGEILRMAKEEGLKIHEIAEILKISPKTVENQLTIGFKKMAASLIEFTDKVIRLRS